MNLCHISPLFYPLSNKGRCSHKSFKTYTYISLLYCNRNMRWKLKNNQLYGVFYSVVDSIQNQIMLQKTILQLLPRKLETCLVLNDSKDSTGNSIIDPTLCTTVYYFSTHRNNCGCSVFNKSGIGPWHFH